MKTWYGGHCKQCFGLNEPYMVIDKVWKKANSDIEGLLCIACVEHNIGRSLKVRDFTTAKINDGIFLFNKKDYVKLGKSYLDLCKRYIQEIK